MEGDSQYKIARIVAGYDLGALTLLEAGSRILECITPQNAATVYSNLPLPLRRELERTVESAPTNDDEWNAAEYIHIRSACDAPGYEPPLKSAEENRAEMQEWKLKHRCRIETLRAFMNRETQ